MDRPESSHGRARAGPAAANRAADEAVDAYAQAALAGEVREVEKAERGGRNARLNLAALRLGGLSAAGVLDEGDIQSKLEEAAAANGLVKEDGIRAVRATIESGARKGRSQPRDLSQIRARAFERASQYGVYASFEADLATGDRHDPFLSAAPSGGARPPDPQPPNLTEFEQVAATQTGSKTRKRKKEVAGEHGGVAPPGSSPTKAWLDQRLSFFPMTDLGNAERFVERCRSRLTWCPAHGWMWWDGRRWNRNEADEKVAAAAHRTVRDIQAEAQWLESGGRTPAETRDLK